MPNTEENIKKFYEAGIQAMRERRQAGLERYWERKRKEREKLEALGHKKRKVGRPKKRGPKKKRKSRAKIKPKTYIPRPKFNWKIVSTLNGKQKEYFDKFNNIQDAYEAFNKLIESNKNIIFPQKEINKGKILESKREYLLLEKNRTDEEKTTLIRNEYGMLVEHKTTNPKWTIIEKAEQLIEETFWVYGYDPRGDRKDFSWIYSNIIVPFDNPYQIKQIIQYKNKLVVYTDEKITGFILCKTQSDSIRLYNLLETYVKKDKNKQIFFLGSYSQNGERKKKLEQDIIDLTGWTKKKIQQKSTRS